MAKKETKKSKRKSDSAPVVNEKRKQEAEARSLNKEALEVEEDEEEGKEEFSKENP